MNDERQRVLSLIREYYGRVAYSHKTLEKDRELLSGDVRFKKWVNIVILTFTSTGVLISLSTDVLWIKIATAFTALASTGYAIYEISFTPELEILEYREAAKKLLRERDRLVLLIERAMSSNTNIDDIRKELEETVERVSTLYAISPDTTGKAYKMATQGLKMNEELTFSSDEIDNLLPASLRLNQTLRTTNPSSSPPTS